MNEFEKKIRNKLLMRGFPNDKLLNNRGLIGATIDEVILEVVKNIGVTRVMLFKIIDKMKELFNKNRNRYVLYILLAVVLMFTACSGDSETGSSLSEWGKQPITEMSIMEFIFVVFFIGLITSR